MVEQRKGEHWHEPLFRGFPEFSPERALARRTGFEDAVARFREGRSKENSPIREIVTLISVWEDSVAKFQMKTNDGRKKCVLTEF